MLPALVGLPVGCQGTLIPHCAVPIDTKMYLFSLEAAQQAAEHLILSSWAQKQLLACKKMAPALLNLVHDQTTLAHSLVPSQEDAQQMCVYG